MPAQPSATSTMPFRNGRPKESVITTPTSGRAPARPADARGRGVRIDRQEHERAHAPARSTRRRRPTRRRSRAGSPRSRAAAGSGRSRPPRRGPPRGAGVVSGCELARALRRLDPSSRTTRPSAFETAFCETTTTSRSSSARARRSARRGRLPRRPRGRPSTGNTRSSDTGQDRLGERATGRRVAHQRPGDDGAHAVRLHVGRAVRHPTRRSRALRSGPGSRRRRSGSCRRPAVEHPVGRALHRPPADERADGDHGRARRSTAARISRDGEDRPDRDEGVARRDHDSSAGRSPRRRPAPVAPSARRRSGPVDVVRVPRPTNHSWNANVPPACRPTSAAGRPSPAGARRGLRTPAASLA